MVLLLQAKRIPGRGFDGKFSKNKSTKQSGTEEFRKQMEELIDSVSVDHR
jgi:hypothetical protein